MTFEQLLDAAIDLLSRRHRITYAALRRQFGLDEQGLEDLKQELILGQRVARDEDGVVLVWHAPGPQPAPAPAPNQAEAERRQITIMFCDLADSTSLSNALDPEELRTVLRAFQDSAGRVITRHQGFVNSYMGDGILTLFGYPRAHEDDAWRAVRAGLELATEVAALEALPGGVRLRVRVGIATGTVVVGDVIGQGASREEAVVGSTPNLAARLQSLALPGQVVVSAGTHRLLGRRFDCQDLGPQVLKGFAEAVPVWRVRCERSDEAASLGDGGELTLPPMVGREIEFPALMDCWRLARAGEGRMVTLRGDAGLGKSRLAEAVRQAAGAQPLLLLRYFCSEQFQNTALYPVISQIRHGAGFAENDTSDERLDKLSRLLMAGLPPDELAAAMPYFAALLSVPTAGRYPASGDSPERQRELTLRALLSIFVALSRERPLLVLFEDLHWADPTTLSLLQRLAEGIVASRVMVLATARPEFEPPWAELPHALTVELGPLKRHHRASIVAQHAGGKTLPPEILEHILVKSDGIPLYVEELTKAMLESGLVSEESERFVLTGPMRSMAVPSTLHDSLLARLDRLSVVKEVAQAGAAIGREFAHATLAAVLSLDPIELNHSLARLTDAGLIHSRGLPPDAVYSFKHALIQDAAYTTMLRPRRQRLHARIAQVLQADAELAQRSPELLAHHFTEADQPEMAVPYRLAAGLQASAGAAHAEACKHFREGLRLAAAMKDDDLRHRLELRLNVHLGMSLAATRGFAAPEVEASNQRARELCQLVGDPDELFWVLRGLCALYIVRADAKTAHELSAQCVRLAQETQRPEFLVEACVMEGYAQGNFGDLTRAREALGQAGQTYRSTAAGRFAYPTPQDPLVASLSLLAVLTLIQGDRAAAAEQMQDAIATAEALERPFDLAFAYTWAAMFESQDRNFAGAAEHAGRAMEISQRHGFDGWLAAGAMQLGVAQAGLGDAPQALALVGGTLPAWQASGAELNIVFFLGGLAEAHHAAGHNEQALETVDRAIAHAEQHGEHWYDAELYRRRGEWRLQQAGAASANAGAAEGEADLRRAIEIAREQGARRFELRAALGLAHALAAVGDRAGAVPVLREALQPFPTATDNIDQREAAALLAELAA